MIVVAQDALVLGSSGHVHPNPTEPAQPAHSIVQSDSTQDSVKPKCACIEPQQSRSRTSLRQWQHELRLLREDQPDQSMRQSGPFLQNGASVIRWTSWHPL